MNRGSARSTRRPRPRRRAAAALAAMPAIVGAAIALAVPAGIAGAAAQTLTAPTATDHRPTPQRHAKPAAGKNPCAAFGIGFTAVPGTDGCIKIGGGVIVEGTGRY